MLKNKSYKKDVLKVPDVALKSYCTFYMNAALLQRQIIFAKCSDAQIVDFRLVTDNSLEMIHL